MARSSAITDTIVSEDSLLNAYFQQANQADPSSAERHFLASKVTKLKGLKFTEIPRESLCPCCFLPISGQAAQCFGLRELDSLAELGVAFPLYFHVNLYLSIMLVIVSVVAAIPNTINNSLQQTESSSSLIHISAGLKMGQQALWPVLLHLVVIVLLCVTYVVFTFRVKGMANVLSENIVTPSDYTVIIKNLGTDWESEDLKRHIEDTMMVEGQNFKVVYINISYDLLEYEKIVKKMNRIKKKWEMYTIHHWQQPTRWRKSWNRLQRVRNYHLELVSKSDIDAEVKDLELEVSALVKQDLPKTGVAIVIFETVLQAHIFFRTYKRGIVRRFLCCCLSILDQLLEFNGHQIYVRKAPEPNDIMWKNLKYGRLKRMMLQVGTLGIMAIVLVGSFLTLWMLAEMQRNLKQSSHQLVTDYLDSVPAASVILIANVIIVFISKKISSVEHHHSYTAENLFVSWKLTWLLALNSLLFPVLLHRETWDWYTPNGLAPEIFYIVLISAFVKPFLKIIDFPRLSLILRRAVLRTQMRKQQCVLTQEEVNKSFEHPEVDIEQWYADLMCKFMLTLAYTPMIPIIAPIMAVGFLVDYWVNKFVLVRLSRRPRQLNGLIARSMFRFVKVAIVVYALGMVVFTVQAVPESEEYCIISLIIAGGFFIFPVSFFRCCFSFLIPKSKEKVAEQHTKQSELFFRVCAM